jgi:hypothetical protein
MKKLILSAAVVLGSFSTYAAIVPSSNEVVCNSVVQDEYKEVKLEQVPDAVKSALETAYPGAVVGKAYINDKKEYKLDIAVGDQKANVYADAKGNWINK